MANVGVARVWFLENWTKLFIGGGTQRTRLSGLPANQMTKEEEKFGCGVAGQCACASFKSASGSPSRRDSPRRLD